jgi:predicted nucleic acid-binding protein
MNRLRSEPKTHLSVFISLILAALVVVTGGVMHAVYKNSQVKTARLIDQAEERIEQTEVKIRMIGVNTDELLDRFDMRERLQENGSTLIAITPADIEEIAPPRSSPKRPAARALP